MSCRSQLQELKAAKTLISCQHFGVIYSPLMASGARRQWAGERWKLSLPPSTLFHLHLRCQSVSITLGGMRSSERSADPLPAPLPEPEGSLIALLMSLLLQIDSCASAKFIHSTPSSIKVNIMTFSIQNVYFPFLVFYHQCFIVKAMKNKLQSQLTATGSEGFESICVKDCITKHILWKRAAYRPLLYCMIFFFFPSHR